MKFMSDESPHIHYKIRQKRHEAITTKHTSTCIHTTTVSASPHKIFGIAEFAGLEYAGRENDRQCRRGGK